MDRETFKYGPTKWNEEVGLYLERSFSAAPVDQLLKRKFGSGFVNMDVYTIGGHPFGINAGGATLELGFAFSDEPYMKPIISALQKWEEFTRFENRFMVRIVDQLGSVLIMFDSGENQDYKGFQKYFSNRDTAELPLTGYPY